MPRFGSPSQQRAFFAALKSSGKFFVKAGAEAGPRAKALKVRLQSIPKSIAGRIAIHTAKKTVEGQNVFVDPTAKILSAQGENLTKVSSSVFGERGVLGQGRTKLREMIHKYAARGRPAPIRKTAAIVASRFAEEASKVAGTVGSEAIRTVHNAPITRTGATAIGVAKGVFRPINSRELVAGRGFSGPGRATSGLTRKGFSRAGGVTHYSGAEGRGLRPAPTSLARDLRHTLFGRTVLKVNKPFQKKLQGIRGFVGRATPGVRPESLGETRQKFLEARGHIGQYRTKLAESATPGVSAAHGAAASQEAYRNLEEGIGKFRDVRRQRRTKGYGNVDLTTVGLLTGAGGIIAGKEVKKYRDEVSRQKLAAIETGARTERFNRMKGYLKKQHPEWTEVELHMETQDAITTMANVDRRLQKTEELAGFDEYNRQQTEQRIRDIKKKDIQTKSPRESKLNSIKGRLKQIGTLFGTKQKPRRVSKGKGKRRRR